MEIQGPASWRAWCSVGFVRDEVMPSDAKRCQAFRCILPCRLKPCLDSVPLCFPMVGAGHAVRSLGPVEFPSFSNRTGERRLLRCSRDARIACFPSGTRRANAAKGCNQTRNLHVACAFSRDTCRSPQVQCLKMAFAMRQAGRQAQGGTLRGELQLPPHWQALRISETI
jgi:hypothetical protein